MIVKKLIIVEEGGTIKILPAYIDEELLENKWMKDFIVDQTNLIDMHSAFLMHVIISKEKK